MREIKFSTKEILKALNGDDEKLRRKIKYSTFEDPCYWYDLYNCSPEEDGSNIINVAKVVNTLSVSDLQQNLDYFDFDSDSLEELLINMFGPYTEGDWNFTDLFSSKFIAENGEERDTKEFFSKIIFYHLKIFIQQNPSVLSDDPENFYTVKKHKTFIFEDSFWREATIEEIRDVEAKLANKEAEILKKEAKRKLILNRLTEEEQEILGLL